MTRSGCALRILLSWVFWFLQRLEHLEQTVQGGCTTVFDRQVVICQVLILQASRLNLERAKSPACFNLKLS